MGYIIYADVIFVWLLFINYITYYITCKITNHQIKKTRLVLWCVLTSILLEAVYISGIFLKTWVMIFCYVILNFLLMLIFVRLILRIYQVLELFRLFTYNILATFLLAGILQLFSSQKPNLIMLIPISIVICLIIPLLFSFFPIKDKENIYEVEIIIRDCSIKTLAYMDTGNTLLDTYSKKPVIILDYNLIRELICPRDIDKLEKYISTGQYHYISELTINQELLHPITYKTISNQAAIMPAFKIRALRVKNNVYRDIVGAISPTPLSKNKEYKVLLNNNL